MTGQTGLCTSLLIVEGRQGGRAGERSGMRVVAQRVREAAVTVDGDVVGEIERGLLILAAELGRDD